MTIAEKILRAKTDYDEVYEAGKSSVIDESKIIEKTAEGTGVVALDDVSELPHDISVQLSGENVGGKQVNVSYGVFNDIDNDFSTLSPYNVCTKIDDDTYSLTPNNKGQIYAIGVDITSLSLNIDDVLHCSVDDISKKGVDHGWRVLYEDGVYNSISGSLKSDIVVDKPIKKLYLYCDAGTQGFTDEPVIFSGVRVVREQTVIVQYTADVDGKVEGIKSISPNMTFICDGVDMSVDYHKSYGMQTEYDRFWDGFQMNGARRTYTYAFYGSAWTDKTYNPKYPLIVTSSNQMYQSCLITDTKVDIDLTRGSGQGSGTTFVFASRLENLRKLIVNENTALRQQFSGCTALKHIKFEGVIGQDINFSACPLSRDSIDNVLDHLKQFDMTWTETTNTRWEQKADGAYPCDKIRIKLNEIPENVTEYKVAYEEGENAGNSGEQYEFFNENGEAEFSSFVYAEDNSGYFQVSAIVTPEWNYMTLAEFNVTIYEGTAPTPSHTVTFKRTAVEAAYSGYTSAYWEYKVKEALNKGWTINLA